MIARHQNIKKQQEQEEKERKSFFFSEKNNMVSFRTEAATGGVLENFANFTGKQNRTPLNDCFY